MAQDFVAFVIEHPPSNHQFPHFDNLKLITFPKPNLNLESSGTQLLVSVDYYNALRVFQFFNQTSIYPMEGFGQAQVRFQMNRPADQFECVKIRAFVLQPREVVKAADFRLMVVVPFRRMTHLPDSRNALTEDLLDVYGFNGEYGRWIVKPISLSDMRTDGQALQPEQLINFDKILDFDVLSTERPNAYYMALIRMELGTDSNSRYKLLFYHMLPGGTKYDPIDYHESGYILNANRVKLAQLNNQIHLICSYTRDSSHSGYGLFYLENSINVFRYSPFVTSVQNETYIANVIAIHHLLDGEEYFYLVTKYSVVVYWWDGGSLIYYDTLLDRSLIKAFNVGKRKKLPPLIVSLDGRSFSTHINKYGQVRPDLQPVVHIPDGFEVKRIEVFNWANNYFVWTLFHRVVDYEPRDSHKIMSYKRCMRSMEEHIEKTIITQVKTLTVKSDDILVVNKAPIALQHKHFHRDLYVNKIVAAGLLTNQHNLTQITLNSLMVYGDQIVTGKHVFLKPVRMGHLMIHPKVRISDRAFEEFVLLDQKDIIIESDVVFDRNLEVKSLTVHGLVGQCNLTDTAQHSIYRNPIDHHFHLTTVYNVPQIVVLRNLQLPRQINGQPNFIPQIGLVDDARPYPNGIRFETNVIANHLVVNARTLVNQQVNVTHLLNDAVYVHVPQHISGHKVFRKPLTIVGSIFMKRHEVDHRPERLFPQLRISGSINRVNISNLLTTTVLSDRQHVIRGNKVFTGRIRFRTFSTQGGQKGNPIPQNSEQRLKRRNEHKSKRPVISERMRNSINLYCYNPGLRFDVRIAVVGEPRTFKTYLFDLLTLGPTNELFEPSIRPEPYEQTFDFEHEFRNIQFVVYPGNNHFLRYENLANFNGVMGFYHFRRDANLLMRKAALMQRFLLFPHHPRLAAIGIYNLNYRWEVLDTEREWWSAGRCWHRFITPPLDQRAIHAFMRNLLQGMFPWL